MKNLKTFESFNFDKDSLARACAKAFADHLDGHFIIRGTGNWSKVYNKNEEPIFSIEIDPTKDYATIIPFRMILDEEKFTIPYENLVEFFNLAGDIYAGAQPIPMRKGRIHSWEKGKTMMEDLVVSMSSTKLKDANDKMGLFDRD